jgi:hypothetical protein
LCPGLDCWFLSGADVEKIQLLLHHGMIEMETSSNGIERAPAFFQRVISTIVLAGMLMIFYELYLDDLIIFAKSVDELIENFRSGVCWSYDQFAWNSL